ncbi:hypothetical protein DRN98_06685, partial [Methanosarcinales archaeon]
MMKKRIIVGGGRTGRELAMQLPGSIIIESDPEAAKKSSKIQGVKVVIGDGTDEKLLQSVGIDGADAFIALTENDDVNYRSASIAKRYGVSKVIVRVEDPENEKKFRDLDVESVMFPTKMVANFIGDLLCCEEKEPVSRPFDRLLVPHIAKTTAEKAFKEALLIASASRKKAKIEVVSYDRSEQKMMEKKAKKWDVPFEFLLDEGELIDMLKHNIHNTDCIIVDDEKITILDRIFPRNIILNLMRSVTSPVLVARSCSYYRHILVLLDSSPASEQNLTIALQIAHLFGADLSLLLLEEIPPEFWGRIKELKTVENVNITKLKVEGNVMIEAVKEVKSEKYDLIVMPWR